MASFLSLDEEVPSSEDLQEGGAISSGGRLGENAVSTDLGGGRRIHEENRLQRPRAINADPGEIHALIITALRCSVGKHAIAEIFFSQELDRPLHRVEPGHCPVSSRLASQPDRRHIPIAAPSSNYYNDKPKMVTVLLSQLQDCEEIRQQGYGLLQRPWLIYPPAVVFQPGLERAFCQLKSRSLKNAQETVLSFIPHLCHLSIFAKRCVECSASRTSIRLEAFGWCLDELSSPRVSSCEEERNNYPQPSALLTFPDALQLESLGQNAPVLLRGVPGSNQTDGKHSRAS
ncbi:hypothetical protein SELMODRAFT_428362 [Selaginella moellendorffii]|uniref:Uncharacterized protein n=1 Tax=Selaginella moellendorffii TaxID=88036 RepID=D8T2K8_SELML|nr:hypothetical protein SELMODRAFT_428362 [Selaginella moellendorffii]